MGWIIAQDTSIRTEVDPAHWRLSRTATRWASVYELHMPWKLTPTGMPVATVVDGAVGAFETGPAHAPVPLRISGAAIAATMDALRKVAAEKILRVDPLRTVELLTTGFPTIDALSLCVFVQLPGVIDNPLLATRRSEATGPSRPSDRPCRGLRLVPNRTGRPRATGPVGPSGGLAIRYALRSNGCVT